MSLFGTKTIYFIDSENVNDNWVEALSDIKKSDEVRVFYTEKSANVSCENISKVAGGDVNLNWIKCFTGQNALDFQLVTDLGYSVAKGSRDAFVIISNDKGYDAVVNYWVIKGINVSRVGVETKAPKKPKKPTTKPKAVRKVQVKKSSETKKAPVKKEASAKKTTQVKKETPAKKATQDKKETSAKKMTPAKKKTNSKVENTRNKSTWDTVWETTPGSDKEYVKAIGRCISVKELNHYHMVLTNLFGQEKGTEYYHKLKDDKELKNEIAKSYLSKKNLQFDYLVRLFLAYNKKGFDDLHYILMVISRKKCDSLNAFYKLLTEQFKEEKGREYYNIFKGIYSILKDMV